MARPRQISDEQILATMRAHALREGPTVSLDAVAQELKVSAPALLKRFGNRQALMVAALRPPEHPEWITFVEEGPSDQPLQAQLTDIFQRITSFMTEAIPCFTVLRESGIPMKEVFQKPTTPELGLRALQRWLKLARERKLVRAPETDVAAFAMLGALQTRAFFAHLTHRKYSEREQRSYAQELAQFFTRALT